MTALVVILAVALWVAVALLLHLLMSFGDGMGRAFGYPTSTLLDHAAVILWPLTLVILLVAVPVAWLWRGGRP